MAEAQKKPGFIARLKVSLQNTKGELKKVVWPDKSQIMNNTGIVLCVMAISAVFVGVLDTVVAELVRLFVNLL